MNSSNDKHNQTGASSDSLLPPSDENPLGPTLTARLTLLVLFLGVGTRVLRYLLRFPLWGDECMLAENLITRTPLGLLQPLDNGQVAPIGFTEALWCMTRLFGFNEWSLRFVALVAGVAALFAMRRFAIRSLSPLSALFAIALLASSYFPIRHTAEVKPYALDLFWCIGLLSLADICRRNPGKIRPLVFLVLATPLAQFTSFTATFVAGGICIGLTTLALLRKSISQLLAAGIYGLVLTAAFALLLFLNASNQFSAHADHMQNYWKNSFPPSPFGQPLQWLIWMIETHTGAMFAYPLGSQSGGSTLTFILVVVGFLRLRHRKDWWFLSTTIGIFGLTYLAAALHRYPYGNTSRLVQHLAPMICILAGVGIESLFERAKTDQLRQSLVKTTYGLMCLIMFGISVFDVVHPYKAQMEYVHSGLARWLWDPTRDSTDTYCVRSDLGYTFWPHTCKSRQICYQYIYSPKHWPGKPLTRVADLPSDRPVNIVVYSAETDQEGGELWNQWWSSMMERFTHLDTIDHRYLEDSSRRLKVWGHYRIYRFIPKTKSL